MKKIFLPFFLYILQYSFSFAQNISIGYLVSVNTNVGITSKKTHYNLIIRNNEAIYYNDLSDSLNQFNYKDVIVDSKKIGEFTKVKLGDNHYEYVTQNILYKNYTKDTIIFNETIPVKTKAIVGENLHLFKWNILPTKDTLILGYKCQTATADFRGRKYTAYFSQELNSFGGPWKFDGLPGLILSVSSQDKYFIIEPIKIALNSANAYIDNPYKELKEEDVLNWQEFKKNFAKSLKSIAKKFKAQNDDGSTLSIKITDRIEDLGISEIKSEK